MQKHQKQNGKRSTHGLRFLARYGQLCTKKGPKTVIFPNACVFLGFINVVGRRSHPKRPKRHFFARGPNPKVLILPWKKVLNKETPSKNFQESECNQQSTFAIDMAENLLLTPCYWQGSVKASSPLNGKVAVFAIVGDRSCAHDQFEEVGLLERAHNGNHGNVHLVYQIYTSRESMYRVSTGGLINRSWTFSFP